MSGLLSNGVWTGVGLASILKECGLKPEAREVVFLGLDMEKEKKAAAGNREFETPHGRSIYVQDALNPEAMLAFSLNGQPLPAEQGFPLRLILPGWYGMTQIKWLGRIQVLDRRYEGQHMTRNYLAVRAVDTPDGPMWLDTSISKTNMKSVVARVARRRAGSEWEYRITGPAWGGQVPIAHVDVQIDDGPWQRATLEPSRGHLCVAVVVVHGEESPAGHAQAAFARDRCEWQDRSRRRPSAASHRQRTGRLFHLDARDPN